MSPVEEAIARHKAAQAAYDAAPWNSSAEITDPLYGAAYDTLMDVAESGSAFLAFSAA